MTHRGSVFSESGQVYDDHTALFPDQLPKVGHGVSQGSLGGHVGRRSRVVVSLRRGGVGWRDGQRGFSGVLVTL